MGYMGYRSCGGAFEVKVIIMPRRSQEAYGNRVVSHYAEGRATEAYCSRAVCLSVTSISRRSLKTKR